MLENPKRNDWAVAPPKCMITLTFFYPGLVLGTDCFCFHVAHIRSLPTPQVSAIGTQVSDGVKLCLRMCGVTGQNLGQGGLGKREIA